MKTAFLVSPFYEVNSAIYQKARKFLEGEGFEVFAPIDYHCTDIASSTAKEFSREAMDRLEASEYVFLVGDVESYIHSWFAGYAYARNKKLCLLVDKNFVYGDCPCILYHSVHSIVNMDSFYEKP